VRRVFLDGGYSSHSGTTTPYGRKAEKFQELHGFHRNTIEQLIWRDPRGDSSEMKKFAEQLDFWGALWLRAIGPVSEEELKKSLKIAIDALSAKQPKTDA
jgi:hypothetical protein